MTEHAPDRLWSGIDIPKTIAGALAAVCAAVIGSFLGVAGTLIGAAVASIIGSVGTEIYARSLKKGTEALAPTFIRAPAAVGTPEVAAATADDSPSDSAPPKERGRIRWGRVAAVAGVLFVLALGSLTVAELLTGRSAASSLDDDRGTAGRTTVTSLFDSGGGHTKPAATPSPTPGAEPSATASRPSPSPAASPTSAAPAPSATVTRSAPPEPAPTATVPRETAPAEEPTPVEPAPQPSE